ncbi:hypothetical protein [Nitrososphaera sp.]|uniref:hypothetical protein n=1 Tax=Nitrososphaera sp. TaxID=1971748 RepID=UPI00307F0C66
MVVEEVRYDFEDYPKYADDFVRDLLKLMIISKLNSTARNAQSKEYFTKLVSQVEGCETNLVKYGQPLLYVKYRGVEFTDQKVASQFVRNGNVIDVTMESVFGEFVRTFDSLASKSDSRVTWGTGDKPDPMFSLLDSFVEAVGRLSSLDPASPNSLAGKRFGVRNAIMSRKSLHIEFLVNGQLNIIELNPARKKKGKAVELLFGSSEEAKAIAALMKQ